MYKIYLLPGDLNDATDYYLNIIKEAIRSIGQSVIVVKDLKGVDYDDIIITIHPKAFYQVWRHNNKQRIIHWFQGVMPEEAVMLFEKQPIKMYPRKWLYTYLEKFVLKRAIFVFFVSNAMYCHYKKKYGYDKSNYLVMPCFNQLLDHNAFNEERYSRPSFVYAGSMSKWQCIEETLQIFKQIKNEIPEATLTLLTKEKEEALRILKIYDLLETEIKYVPYTKLNEELSKYKFGFIIRKNDPVNNVATPTKMNSYLANGVIPIYSNYIHDFKENLSSYSYLVAFSNVKECLSDLKVLEGISSYELYDEYQLIFKDYYNENKYVSLISEKLNSI